MKNPLYAEIDLLKKTLQYVQKELSKSLPQNDKLMVRIAKALEGVKS